MLMMDQLMEGWNTTSVHLVTVSAAEWMVVVASVITSIIMRTMISSVSVTEKVLYIYIYISNPKQPSCKKSVRPSERLW